jgi:predicted ArsR family transcriptional regulator
MDLAAQAAGIGALADPTRRALYEFVVSQPTPVGREAAAAAVEVPGHRANFHLDRLVDEGLLAVEFRRLTGRAGPGAGRPAKLYRRADRDWSVSLPPRRYDLVGHLLAAGVERAHREQVAVDDALHDAALEEGIATGIAGRSHSLTATLTEVLTRQGYEPRTEHDTLILANCPFDSLAQEHTALVCGLNRSFVQGIAQGLDDDAHACLEPEPGLCCVKIRNRRASAS